MLSVFFAEIPQCQSLEYCSHIHRMCSNFCCIDREKSWFYACCDDCRLSIGPSRCEDRDLKPSKNDNEENDDDNKKKVKSSNTVEISTFMTLTLVYIAVALLIVIIIIWLVVLCLRRQRNKKVILQPTYLRLPSLYGVSFYCVCKTY